jgi:O-antigen/teichoic acid export membrane protein
MTALGMKAQLHRAFHRLAQSTSVRHGALLFLGASLGSVGLFLFRFVAAHELSVEDYGVLATLLAVIALVAQSAAVGTALIARLSAQIHALDDPAKLRRLGNLVLLGCAFALGAGVLAAAALTPPLTAFLHLTSTQAVAMTIALCAMGVVLALQRGILQGVQRFKIYSVSQIVENWGKAAVASGAILAGWGFTGAIAAQIVAAVAAIAYAGFGLKSLVGKPDARLGVETRELLHVTLGAGSAYLASAMLIQIDMILARHFLSPFAAGIYGIAVLPARAVVTVMYFLPTMLLPKTVAHSAQGRSAGRLLLNVMAIAIVVWASALAAFRVAPHAIIHLIANNAYASAEPLIFPAGVSGMLYSLANTAINYRTAFNRFFFAISLNVVVVAEVAAVAAFHASALEIIYVTLATNAAALIVSLAGIRSHERRP